MYHFSPGLILGFHGCDEELRDAIITGKKMLQESRNNYDWLGSGIYFWENDLYRAMDFAQNHPTNKNIRNPAVIGAVINPGHCLDLSNMRYLHMIMESCNSLVGSGFQIYNLNKNSKNTGMHKLDCHVIENLHQMRQSLRQPPFESVRSAFSEGPELYPGAGFHEKNHIQICVRNPNCIKGFFIPRQETDWP